MLDRLADGNMWVEQLLVLFWEVDEVVKDRPDAVDPQIIQAYRAAERARREMART